MPTDDVRLDRNAVTDVDVIDTGTHLVHHPGELVTESSGDLLVFVCEVAPA